MSPYFDAIHTGTTEGRPRRHAAEADEVPKLRAKLLDLEPRDGSAANNRAWSDSDRHGIGSTLHRDNLQHLREYSAIQRLNARAGATVWNASSQIRSTWYRPILLRQIPMIHQSSWEAASQSDITRGQSTC